MPCLDPDSARGSSARAGCAPSDCAVWSAVVWGCHGRPAHGARADRVGWAGTLCRGHVSGRLRHIVGSHRADHDPLHSGFRRCRHSNSISHCHDGRLGRRWHADFRPPRLHHRGDAWSNRQCNDRRRITRMTVRPAPISRTMVRPTSSCSLAVRLARRRSAASTGEAKPT